MPPLGEKIGPYRIESPLGQGSLGEVFLASERGKKCALKFFNAASDPAYLALFHQEVRWLSQLSHPNLVRIFDFFAPERSRYPVPFFVMEYLEGRTLDGLPAETVFSDWEKIFLQCFLGLHYLHGKGILHRDLKPNNLILTSDSVLKILDFSLSVQRESGDSATAAVGTYPFMAPETFEGRYHERSDLFALGAVFYRLLSGNFPFSKPLHSKYLGGMSPPVPLRELRADIPEYFSDLIAKLLDFSPASRPSSALTVLKYLPLHSRLPKEFFETQFSGFQKENLPLVGRDAEMEEIEAFWQNPTAAPGWRGILLQGPTGIGRSRLIEEIRWKYLLKGRQVAVLEAPISDDWPAALAEKLGVPIGQDSSETVFFLADRLESETESPPLILLPDLSQWSVPALAYLASWMKLCTKRKLAVRLLLENNSDGRPLEASLSGIEKDFSSWLRIDLKDLTRQASEKLIRNVDLLSQLSPEGIGEIASASGGRPLLAVELVREGLKISSGDSSAVDLKLPQNLREVYRVKLLGLGSGARELLALFLAGRSVELADLKALIPEAPASLSELKASQLLEDSDGALRLRHFSLKNLLLSLMDAEELRRAHRSWADRESQRVQEDPEDLPALFRWVDHAIWLDDEEPLSQQGLRALFALDLGKDAARALAWSDRFLKMSPDRIDHCGIHALRAPLFYRLARYPEALAAYRLWFQLRKDDETRLQEAKFYYYSGLVHFGATSWDPALKELASCLQTGDSQLHPALRPYHAQAHQLIATILGQQGSLDQAKVHLQTALKIGWEDPSFQAELELRLGELELQSLSWQASQELLEKARDDFLASPRAASAALAENSLAVLAMEKGEYPRALSHAETAAQAMLAAGERGASARFEGNRALLLAHLGRLAKAKSAMRRSSEWLEIFGSEKEKRIGEIQDAQIQLYLGNLEKFNEALQRLRGYQELLIAEQLWHSVLCLRAEAALTTGDFQRASDIYEAVGKDDPESLTLKSLQTLVGRLKTRHLCRGLTRSDLVALQDLREKIFPAPLYRDWWTLFEFLANPPEKNGAIGFATLYEALAASESPQLRLERLYHLQVYFSRHRLQKFGEKILSQRKSEWEKIFHSLPEELQMDYQKNLNLLDAEKALETPVQAAPPSPAITAPVQVPTPSPDPGTAISESKFRQFCEISNQISYQTELKEILERVMDAAILLTGAERGFLILRSEGAKNSAIPGFEIQVARHLNSQALENSDFQFSWSVVKKALAEGSAIHTHNALEEEEFREMKSVHALQLRSILALPMETNGQILGVIYLDNRIQANRFQASDILILSGFANQASSAIQKQQMLEELRQVKAQLEGRVQDQEQRIEVLSEELSQSRDNLKYEYRDIIGNSPAMMTVFKLLDHVSKTKIPVWIWGESGTGKELIARSLHDNSPRKSAAFVAENCSSIPENLLESELFGHKKGSFTHADRDRIGLFEQADGGTLFLDEVADMSLAMQAKLLRVLQEEEIRPLGSNKKIKVDVRLVTASNRDLAEMVEKQTFREDLFYRINGMTISLPPLRDRKEDIPLLVHHLMKRISRSYQLPDCKVSQEALEFLMAQAWPGNIRQLEGVIRNSMMFADGKTITGKILKSNGLLQARGRGAAKAATSATGLAAPMNDEERSQLIECLRRHSLDKKLVAEELGITPKSVYVRMEKFGIPKKNSLLMKYLQNLG